MLVKEADARGNNIVAIANRIAAAACVMDPEEFANELILVGGMDPHDVRLALAGARILLEGRDEDV